ncbi:mRNA interferase MazF [Planifilum fimeticola]|jgi:mRNA interferase MazF|uniref:mRNA interferase n=1 Tax=Planifilum fimeticola TaxID=201975 RepID=A0A2T0LAI3_9BACL|nr:type II toxin-antitoxin system PemK/MazF family toxin [Planifilum fimeticola]PRX38827.1 mRNA interferase MazF [Planifilum fimeticola]
MNMKIVRGQVWKVNLDPTRGAEMKKLRPCVVVSADSIGKLPLKVIVPITEWKEIYASYPWIVKLEPNVQNGLDKLSAADAFQVKSLSTERFVKQLGVLAEEEIDDIVSAIGIVIQIPI